MGSREELEAALSAVTGPKWETPRDLNRISLDALFGAGSGGRVMRSSGSVRMYGANVVEHSARLDATAEVLSQLQRLVTAMGAARRGIRSSQGPLPGELVALTQLKIAAAPAAGSLVFDLVPESLPETELLAEGSVAIFDQAQRQFLDECFEDAIGLVFAAHTIGPDPDGPAAIGVLIPEGQLIDDPFEPVHGSYPPNSGRDTALEAVAAEGALVPRELESAEAHTFITSVREGGPRLAAAVRSFAKAIESADFDVDLEWREPNQATLRAKFTRHDASLVRHLIVSRDLEIEQQDLVGRLITLSTTKAWQLAVGQDSIVTVDASKLAPTERSAFHLEQQVTIRARAIQHSLPGGGTNTTFEALTVRSMEQD